MLGHILTWDNVLHALVAALLVYALQFLGLWSLPIAVSLGFYAREMEQAATNGARWKPWRWSWHRHAEYIVPSIVAVLTFSLI